MSSKILKSTLDVCQRLDARHAHRPQSRHHRQLARFVARLRQAPRPRLPPRARLARRARPRHMVDAEVGGGSIAHPATAADQRVDHRVRVDPRRAVPDIVQDRQNARGGAIRVPPRGHHIRRIVPGADHVHIPAGVTQVTRHAAEAAVVDLVVVTARDLVRTRRAIRVPTRAPDPVDDDDDELHLYKPRMSCFFNRRAHFSSLFGVFLLFFSRMNTHSSIYTFTHTQHTRKINKQLMLL